MKRGGAEGAEAEGYIYISRVCLSQVPRTSVNAEPNRRVIGMCSSHETVQYCQGGCNNSTQ